MRNKTKQGPEPIARDPILARGFLSEVEEFFFRGQHHRHSFGGPFASKRIIKVCLPQPCNFTFLKNVFNTFLFA